MSIQRRLVIGSPFSQHCARDKVEHTQNKDHCVSATHVFSLFLAIFILHIRSQLLMLGATQKLLKRLKTPAWIKREKHAKHKNLF